MRSIKLLPAIFAVNSFYFSAISLAGAYDAVGIACCFQAQTIIKDQSLRANHGECLRWVKKIRILEAK